MDGALVKLAHLRWTAERSRTLSAQVAAAAAEAIGEVAASAVTAEQLSSVVKEAVQEGIREAASGGSLSGKPLDPMEVYKATRPADWLSMPEPAGNEMYLLFHIPDGASSLLAFTATCTGSYTVALGTVEGGQFVQRSAVSVDSGAKYETELAAADWTDLTSDGCRQVMIKVSGAELLTWEPSVHSRKSSPASFSNWNIVEIACRLPAGTRLSCGHATANRALSNLRYFAWYGENCAVNLNSMFYFCRSLAAVLALDTSKAVDMGYLFSNCAALLAVPTLDMSKVETVDRMFNSCTAIPAVPPVDTSRAASLAQLFADCSSLREVPALDTSLATDLSYLFSNCFALQKVPDLDTRNAASMSYLFRGCRSLTSVPKLDTSQATSMSYLFSDCWSLTSVPELDMTKVTSASYLFSNCYSLLRVPRLKGYRAAASSGFTNCGVLSELRFDPDVSGWAGYATSLSGGSLNHDAIVALLESLPSITSAKVLTLTGNPGVPELTEEEKAIATGKKWMLTL